MKARIFLSLFLFYSLFSMGQIPDFGWAFRIGSNSHARTLSTSVDANGNVFTLGYFKLTVDFDPGPGVYNLSAPTSTIYLLKLNASGQFEWAKKLEFSAKKVITDKSGNLYVTGDFQGTVDFDPDTSSFNMSSGTGNINSTYILKLDADGNFIWAKQIVGYQSDGKDLAVDGNNNIFFGGCFRGTADLNPGSGVHSVTSAGNWSSPTYDAFVLKLDSNGTFIWARTVGANFYDSVESLSTDAAGNVYSTGSCNNPIDIDPTSGVFNLPAGIDDIFIQKLSPSGSFVWGKLIKGIYTDFAYSIAADPQGNTYTTGTFRNTVDFDPNAGVFNLTAFGTAGSWDIFFLKLNAAGNLVWAKRIGGQGYEYVHESVLDGSGNLYTVGSFYNTVDFNPGSGTFNLSAPNGTSGFTQKLTSAGTFEWAFQIGNNSNSHDCTTISVNDGGNVYVSGDFEGNNVDFDPSAGVYPMSTSGNGSSNGYLLKLNNCTSTASTDSIISCEPITWLDGNTYDSTTTASFIMVNAAQCDSIITLNFTLDAIDTTLALSGTQILSNELNATYQWLDCSANYAQISGETGRGFTPPANGSYAVEITKMNCIDTSACQTVANVGLAEWGKGDFKIFPNPAASELQIEGLIEFDEVEIFNSAGQLLLQESKPSSGIDISSLTNGVYVVKITAGDGVFYKRIVKRSN